MSEDDPEKSEDTPDFPQGENLHSEEVSLPALGDMGHDGVRRGAEIGRDGWATAVGGRREGRRTGMV